MSGMPVRFLNSGDFRLRRIGQQTVIMVRDDDGQVQLFMNRCPHRANAVCQVERGNTKAFRCAYHGWSFATNGELKGIPYQDRYPSSFRKEDHGLRKVPRMETYRGFVFGSLSPVGISLDDHLGPRVKEQIDLCIDLSPVGELDVTAGVHKYGYRANWKFQIENSMDGYHPNFVHQTFFTNIQHRTGRKLTDLFTSRVLCANAGFWQRTCHVGSASLQQRKILSLAGSESGRPPKGAVSRRDDYQIWC